MREKRGQKRKSGAFRKPAGRSHIVEMLGGGWEVDLGLYFCKYRNMRKPDPLVVSRSVDRFAALGAEPRLQIMRILLSAHPTGMVAGEIQEELGIPASTLSHHLERLKQVELVVVRRASTFLWYKANTEALKEVLGFLYEECCTRNRVVPAEAIVEISRS